MRKALAVISGTSGCPGDGLSPESHRGASRREEVRFRALILKVEETRVADGWGSKP